MQRPVSIVWFERCYLGGVAVGLLNTALSWNHVLAMFAENPQTAAMGPSFGSGMLIGGTLLGLLISVVLWYFTARQGSVVTKWIITAFFAIGLLGLARSAVSGMAPEGLSGVLAVVSWVLDGIAVWQLFKPDAKVWFGESKA